ncbi:hypothetical protein HDU97_003864 [Phlyctochytrium planicorne]|nr:hypothetical protein HDU97_003864 [Phlyctochytrium planicorne]
MAPTSPLPHHRQVHYYQALPANTSSSSSTSPKSSTSPAAPLTPQSPSPYTSSHHPPHPHHPHHHHGSPVTSSTAATPHPPRRLPCWLLILLPILTIKVIISAITLITITNVDNLPNPKAAVSEDHLYEPDVVALPQHLQVPHDPHITLDANTPAPLTPTGSIDAANSKVADDLEDDDEEDSLPNIAPLPCTSTNNQYYASSDFSPWTDADVDAHRRDWQIWLSSRYVTHYSNFNVASETVERRGLPPYKGRGIVTVFGTDSHFKFFNASVTVLRKLNCSLPIEVWSFANELKLSTLERIRSMSSPEAPIRIRFADDSRNFLPLSRGTVKAAFHSKVAATLNSGFREFLFLDVDVIPLKNPEYLFESVEFRKKGTLFWPDYWKTNSKNPMWRWMNQTCVDEWEQESGVMVIDKQRAWKALVLNWYLNRNEKIRKWHRFAWGDKELFRFSWKATGTPVHFIQHWLTPGGFLTPVAGGSRIPVLGGLPVASPPLTSSSSVQKHPFCGIAMMQHDPKGNVLFAHVNYLKHNGKYFFTEDLPPLRYMKRYKPLFNVNLPEWYVKARGGPIKHPREPAAIHPSRSKRRLRDPLPGALPGSLPAFAGTEGARAHNVFPMSYECLDIIDIHTPREGSLEKGIDREAEIIDLQTEFPGMPQAVYNMVVKEDAEASRKAYHRAATVWIIGLVVFALAGAWVFCWIRSRAQFVQRTARTFETNIKMMHYNQNGVRVVPSATSAAAGVAVVTPNRTWRGAWWDSVAGLGGAVGVGGAAGRTPVLPSAVPPPKRGNSVNSASGASAGRSWMGWFYNGLPDSPDVEVDFGRKDLYD